MPLVSFMTETLLTVFWNLKESLKNNVNHTAIKDIVCFKNIIKFLDYYLTQIEKIYSIENYFIHQSQYIFLSI